MTTHPDTLTPPSWFPKDAESEREEQEKYWAYVYPDGRFYKAWLSSHGWERGPYKKGTWQLASSNVNDIVGAMRWLDDHGMWCASDPKYSGSLVQVTLEELGSGVAVIDGWPNVRRFIP